MRDNLQTLTYLIVCLMIVAFVAQTLSYLVRSSESSRGEATASEEVYLDEFGNLKYAFGSCSTDDNCFVGGCSSEICADQPDVASTCDLKPDAPGSEYSCGCFSGACAWIKR